MSVNISPCIQGEGQGRGRGGGKGQGEGQGEGRVGDGERKSKGEGWTGRAVSVLPQSSQLLPSLSFPSQQPNSYHCS